MVISKDKTRYSLSIEKEVKEKLEQEAKKQNRSLNNLIETILKNYLTNK
ncbi:ribbon-helix-helix protein, CopG family [Bacillus sp. SRB_8]|nr:ribbon-helix-helix protein, CopG family [Bacillus sp. SRB_8]RAN68725.1 DNA-binding protein [Bacillus sp. SRB_8]